jgi:alpha-mannosidase
VNVRSSQATYEIQFATIQRPTHRNTPFDRARFEVAHHRWADLSEGDYGVTVANDCKYGFDTHDNVMRLSLLRSPICPDPHADEGRHEFVYSLLPHSGDWRDAEAVRRGLELNLPVRAVPATNHPGDLPATHSRVRCDAANVVVETLKKEERGDRLVLRLYESQGCRGPVTIDFGFPVKKIWECNLVEEEDREISITRNRLKMGVAPFEIRTFKLEVGRSVRM